MTTDIRALCAELLDWIERASCCHVYGTQDLIARARAALAAVPVGEGPSERIVSIAKAVQECAVAHESGARLIGNVCAEDVADLCDAILARWARPAAPPAPLPPGYIDPEHHGENLELLETFYGGCNAEGGTADEIHLRGIRAVLAARPAAPAAPETGEMLTSLANRLENAISSWDDYYDDNGKPHANRYVKDRGIIAAARAHAATLLQQLSAPSPAVVPVAVAERPWEREGWCDEQGYCWFFYPRFNTWSWERPPVALTRFGSFLSLPHHAIPLPQGGEGEGLP
jgi:broad specificity phosphatase PhoE